MAKTIPSTYHDRVKTLTRRRDFLDKRIADYRGTDASRDKAESSALHWALGIIQSDVEKAMDAIQQERDFKNE